MLSVLFLPLLAGIGTVLAAAPLGCFVIWRRMAFFGDATAHAAILGVAGALALQLPVFAGALLVALAMAALLTVLKRRGHAADTALGVMSHGALALGLCAVALVPGIRVDLMGLLFGDILAVSAGETALIWGGATLVLGLLAWRWSALLTATINPDLARAAGVDPAREELVFTLTLALTVAVAIKAVGVLLIGALLVIPAAAARPLAKGPEAMAVIAGLIGFAAVGLGFAASLWLDTPTGPSIAAAALGLFMLTQGARQSA